MGRECVFILFQAGSKVTMLYAVQSDTAHCMDTAGARHHTQTNGAHRFTRLVRDSEWHARNNHTSTKTNQQLKFLVNAQVGFAVG